MTGYDVISQAHSLAAAAAQDFIPTNAPTDAPPTAAPDLTGSVSEKLPAGVRAKVALIGTILFIGFFAGLAWALGELTGESLLNKVESVVA